MLRNLLLKTDSYKVSHYRQYPPKTTLVHSYLESRGGDYPSVVFFGLQYYLMTAFTRPISKEDIDEADSMYAEHFGDPGLFNRKGWEYILDTYGGYLPLRIRAVPEGTRVPVSNVLMTVENTDPNVPWLTNYMETRLSQVWYPTTVATLSLSCRKIIMDALVKSADVPNADFKLHDFGYRGSTSDESAMIGGMAHLIGFSVTDTVAALVGAKTFYHATAMPGFSIPAAEHSTITSWGKEHEVDAYGNMLTQFPSGLVAVVSDSYNIYAACEKLWGEALKDRVLSRNGTVVIRPDSGDPLEVVPKVVEILGNKFGFTVNQKGYKLLDSHVRVIQGDGVSPTMIELILTKLMQLGWSADNVGFGMGGGLLQSVNRDTCQFAFKTSAIVAGGDIIPVSKDPITSQAKRSKAGILTLVKDTSGAMNTVDYRAVKSDDVDMMSTVYDNGSILRWTTFDEIRNRAR